MSLRLSRPIVAAFAAVALVASGCERPSGPTAPAASAKPRASLLGAITDPVWTLLACPTDEALSGREVIGPEGGSVTAGGFRIDFPAGAVRAQQAFVLNVVRGQYLEIEAHGEGHERFDFAEPVTVTMDLSRCGVLPPKLHAFHFDTQTGALLEDMGGSLDLVGRTLRFRTSHFSGYSIAWKTEDDTNRDSTSNP